MRSQYPLPWADCKVAFTIDNEEPVWQLSRDQSRLPAGWTLEETDGAGARWLAIFRLAGVVPTVADGQRVLAALREVGSL